MQTILVSEISFNKAKTTFEEINASQTDFVFQAAVDAEDILAEEIRQRGVRGFIADLEPYQGPLYQALGSGSVISRYGVGHDSIDKTKAKAAGVTVCNTPGVLDNAVAEHAVGMICALARKLPQGHQSTHSGQWQPSGGVELRGRKVAILGCGRIGQALAKKLGIGLEMHVIGHDIIEDFQCSETSGFSDYTTNRQQAIEDSDFVICLLPVLDSTKHFADAEFFAQMKKGAYFINSARGALVQENDLFDAVESGHLAGAGLDVFEVEPYVPQSPQKDLRTLPQIVMTPHVGSNTAESNAAMAQTAADNVMTVLTKGPAACANVVS